MAGLQTIIDNCNGLQIDRRKSVGQQFTRNSIPRVSVTPTRNPWQFIVDMPSSFRYSEARALIEEIDRLDRYLPETITFSNVSQFSWMFKYQGTCTAGQIATMTVVSFTGDQLVLTKPTGPSVGAVIFEPNDIIQIGGSNVYPYPFTSTTQVVQPSGANITITTNRPNILTGTLTGLGVIVGNNVQFKMFCPNMPTYKLTPGGYVGNQTTTTNNALIEWSDSFRLYEYVGTA